MGSQLLEREHILTFAAEQGVRVLRDPNWDYRQHGMGAYYTSNNGKGFILLPASVPAQNERWLLAHELGHHVNRHELSTDSERVAEWKADTWAVGYLQEHYPDDAIAYPDRVQAIREALRGYGA